MNGEVRRRSKGLYAIFRQDQAAHPMPEGRKEQLLKQMQAMLGQVKGGAPP